MQWEELEPAADGVQRRAELVGERGKKAILDAVRFFGEGAGTLLAGQQFTLRLPDPSAFDGPAHAMCEPRVLPGPFQNVIGESLSKPFGGDFLAAAVREH